MILDWREVRSVYVGDTGAWEFTWLKADNRTVRDLTGFAAWVSFWHAGSAPHVVRAALVGGSNGIVSYEMKGDEYAVADENGILIQPSVLYVGGGAFYIEDSYPAVRRIVKRRPT